MLHVHVYIATLACRAIPTCTCMIAFHRVESIYICFHVCIYMYMYVCHLHEYEHRSVIYIMNDVTDQN